MLFGNKNEFAVEAIHERLSDDETHVFGRMCLWLGGEMLGDLSEPSCMLDVTAGFFESILGRFSDLSVQEFSGLSDSEAFNLLNSKIYEDDTRSADQVATDSRIYFKFDFLTNGGESFDNSKSFIVVEKGSVRVLFYNYDVDKLFSHKVPIFEFKTCINQFLAWYHSIRSKLTCC